jgi:hypothetical protein
MSGHRAAEHLRRDVRLGRAAGVREQARVVGLRGGLAIDAQPVGYPHRDQRRLQAVLEREAHAEVRRQAKRPNQLGGADSLAGL